MAFRPCVSVSCDFDDWFTCACAICMLCCAVAITSTHICAGSVSSAKSGVADFHWISTHICVGNVLCDACIRHFSNYGFNSYMCGGMFRCRPGIPAHGHKFQFIYVWECLSRKEVSADVSIHICAGNVSKGMMLLLIAFWRFNSYMRGECFGIINIIVCLRDVSTHICARNVFILWRAVK